MAENIEELQSRIKTLEAELTKYKAEEQAIQAHIKLFDELDFVAYSQGVPKHDFDRFNALHTEDVIVYNAGELEPFTTNLKDHGETLLAFFQLSPDHKAVEHPISFGQGDWICVVGVMEGTFSGTLIGPDGKQIPPNGKRFRSAMVTVAKWKDGQICEEHLFIPMDTIMKQVGLM